VWTTDPGCYLSCKIAGPEKIIEYKTRITTTEKKMKQSRGISYAAYWQYCSQAVYVTF